MESSYTVGDGRKIKVLVNDDGSVAVTGATDVRLVVPYAFRGHSPKFYPRGAPDGQLEVILKAPDETGNLEVAFQAGGQSISGAEKFTVPAMPVCETSGREFAY